MTNIPADRRSAFLVLPLGGSPLMLWFVLRPDSQFSLGSHL